jgi:hypothetical protein
MRVLSHKSLPGGYFSDIDQGIIVTGTSPRYVNPLSLEPSPIESQFDMAEYVQNGFVMYDGARFPENNAMKYLLVASKSEIENYVSPTFNLDGYAVIAYGDNEHPHFNDVVSDRSCASTLYVCAANDDFTDTDNWVNYESIEEYIIIVDASAKLSRDQASSEVIKDIISRTASTSVYPGKVTLSDPSIATVISYVSDNPKDDEFETYFCNRDFVDYKLNSDTFSTRASSDIVKNRYRVLYYFESGPWFKRIVTVNPSLMDSTVQNVSNVYVRSNKMLPEIEMFQTDAQESPIQCLTRSNLTPTYVHKLPLYDGGSVTFGLPDVSTCIYQPSWVTE